MLRSISVIRSFRHKGIERFFLTGSKAGIQPKHASRLRILLTTLNLSSTPLDREGWGWHPLKANLRGHWAVTVSGNWRLTFSFAGGGRRFCRLLGLPLACIIHVVEGAKSLLCYKHVVKTVFEATK